MKQKIWQKFSVLCMVLALMMPSIVQATEIVATSEAEVSTDKMAEETSETEEEIEIFDEELVNKDSEAEYIVEGDASADLKTDNHSNENESPDPGTGNKNEFIKEETVNTEESESEQVEPKLEITSTNVIVNDMEFSFGGSEGNSFAELVGYHGGGGDVVIPSEVVNSADGWTMPSPVTGIGFNALRNKGLTSVKIPNSIEMIGSGAFRENDLTSLEIPASVKVILNNAFQSNNLTSINLSSGIEEIQTAAFSFNKLTSIEIPASITSIGTNAFSNNSTLANVKILNPHDELSFGSSVFTNSPVQYIETEVESVNKLLEVLNPSAMYFVNARTILRALDYKSGTEKALEVGLGEDVGYEISQQYQVESTSNEIWKEYTPTVQWMKNGATLSGETNPLLALDSVTANDSGVYHAVVDGVIFPELTLKVEEQNEFEFEFSGTDGNSTATLIGYNGAGGDVVIPSETVNREAGWESSSPVTVIGRSAFYGKQLTNVTIPDGVTSLDAFAFYDNQLTNVELPDTITNIGSYVFAWNELTDIYIPDSVRNFEVRVFEGNPLRYIETNRDNLLNLRMIINPAVVLPNVTETTVLRALEYTEETEINSEVVIGSHVHYQISNQYIIVGREWMEHLPTVYWFKDDIQIADQTGKGIVIQDLQESDSGIYKAIVDGTPFPDLQLEVIPEIEPEIPAIDPSEPPASPENVNPDVAGLSIRYASDIHFKSAPFSISDQDLFLDSQENQPMVTIQDMRPKSERSGWELLVSQDTSFMNGAEIVMNPFIHQANQDNLLIDPSSELVLNDAPQRFAGTTTNQSNPFGIVSMGMESEGKPMRLRVPEKTGIGSYETTVHWQLVTGP
ncbi:leucine-rich repeat protein [Enterococcus thailandicus]|uniref:leucine-rich repeat protein n=1 Tax=Enterococcus thailandicus TaxID=417368 RepID=UPI0032E397DD